MNYREHMSTAKWHNIASLQRSYAPGTTELLQTVLKYTDKVIRGGILAVSGVVLYTILCSWEHA